MPYLQNAINNVNPGTPTNEIGAFITKGVSAAITLDTDPGFIFKYVRVRTAGDLDVLGIDGNSFIYPDAQPGENHPIVGQQILSAGTTATGIFVFGGD